jgi:hypothetical protein
MLLYFKGSFFFGPEEAMPSVRVVKVKFHFLNYFVDV